ncbi:hypothetical protein Cfor_07170 [Coptotermes formosanus]|uniref:SEFIR domain-containing protein n=1 Tax=Coptotermes formosanus TaxID=36987 RepID=A0A6L2PXS6_COPFO|nr:hypothetical protein Cfor_07170 [Coptotermes formosanus]
MLCVEIFLALELQGQPALPIQASVTQSVTLKHVYQGCYRLGYIYKVDNKATQNLMIQYLKTAYKKEENPCDNTYITPNIIKRNTMEILMANFSKFDRIEAIVTKPEGDFTCDEKTDLRRFMWVMSHDSNGTFMCKRNGKKENEEISCKKYNHNIECTLHNIASGNYCYYVTMSHVYCNPVNSKRGLHQKFTIPEDPPPAKAQEQTADTYIILTVIFSCLVTACVIVIITIRKRKSASLLELYFNVEEYPLPQIQKILLLYARDCEQFMKMMITFRDLLADMTKCKVYDCFDSGLGEEVGQSKVDWMRSHVSSDDFKIVVVESSVAVIHHQALLHYTKVSYREPTWLDELFIYGLKELTDDLQGKVYQRVFVIRFDGFTEENDFLKYLVPYKRYILPRHLGMLLDDLSLRSNLRAVPCFDDINDGDLQKFDQDLKRLVNYKKLDPDYLDELILRE